MTELYDIIARLRKGHGIREIHRALGVHRTIIRTLRDIAQEEGWLKPTCPLPTEELIQRRLRHSLDDKPPRAKVGVRNPKRGGRSRTAAFLFSPMTTFGIP